MATRIYTKATVAPQMCSYCQKPIKAGQRMAAEFKQGDHMAVAHYHEVCWDIVSTQPPYFVPDNG